MSYTARGSGVINTVKPISNDAMNSLKNIFSVDIYPDGDVEVTHNGHYNEEDVLDALEAVTDFCKDGSEVNFIGEDDSLWRFICRKGHWIEESGSIAYEEGRMRTFNVRYTDPDNMDDETQLDVKNSDFVTMFNDLASLFGGFCAENYGDDPCWIQEIEEVAYDGD